jgi:glycosyltransferase involved in cell wall biosynthesis
VHVLFLTHNFPRHDGDRPGSFLLRLGRALVDAGARVSVLAPSAPGLATRETTSGLRVERVRYAPGRLETLAYGGDMIARVRGTLAGTPLLAAMLGALAVRTRSVARREQVDVVHAHWWFPSGVAAAAAHLGAGWPLVTTLHGSDLRIARDVAPMRGLFRRVARTSARVVAVSAWLADEAERLAPGIDVDVAPMPVDPAPFATPASPPADRLLFVGKLDEQKGSAWLLRALARMHRPATVDLVVAPGGDEGAIRALAGSLGVADRLRWHGVLSTERLAGLHRASTALVVPSVDEGLGLVAVEAQLAGRPVVAFDSGGLRDIVVDGETGRLVPPRDVDALARALDDVLGRPDRGAALGAAGRRRALGRFSPEAAARRHLEIYRAAGGGARE